jgi:hypothetical protein
MRANSSAINEYNLTQTSAVKKSLNPIYEWLVIISKNCLAEL